MRLGFLSLKRFWIQERIEYFCPENTGAFGVPLLLWINTAWLGSRLLYLISGQELQTPGMCLAMRPANHGKRHQGSLSSSPCDDLSASSFIPCPLLDTRIPWTQKLENKDAKQLPLWPLPPWFRMHSYNSRYKMKQWLHMDLFVWKKKKKSNTFLSSVSKFTFA